MKLNWVFVLVASLASLAACRGARFIKPPPWNLLDDGLRNLSNNKRYQADAIIPIVLSNNTKVSPEDVQVKQLNTGRRKGRPAVYDRVIGTRSPFVFLWMAKYDVCNYLENGEDAVYSFRIPGPGKRRSFRYSAFFNVSSPDSVKAPISKAPETSSLSSQSTTKSTAKSTTQPSAESTATKKPSRQRKKSSTRSGLTGPQVAGIVIGAVVAFILMVAGFCWGFERMRVARQLQRSHEFELRNMERDVRALRETVSKLGS